MRGSYTGALERTYLHSSITEALWMAVAEADRLFNAQLAHAMMLASLYGNPSARLDEGNKHVHKMYIQALGVLPYIDTAGGRQSGDTADLVEEWRRLNEHAGSVEKGGGNAD